MTNYTLEELDLSIQRGESISSNDLNQLWYSKIELEKSKKENGK